MNSGNNKTDTIRLIFGLTLLCTLVVSCRTTQPVVDSKDLSYIYNPAKNIMNPRYNVFIESENSSVLSVKFFESDMFFSEANPEGIPIAEILLSVKLFNITGTRSLTDTAAYNLKIQKEESQPEYIYNVPLRVEPGNEYVAEVKILDKIRQKIIQAFVPFNTLSENNRYNFIVRGHFQKNPLFNNVVHINEFINLAYPVKSIDSIFISFYKPVEEIPYPPSMILPEKIIDYDPDTTVALAYSDTVPLMFPKKGIYLCTTGENITDGYTFCNFGETYPSMTTPEVMIETLAYLASEDEMYSLRNSPKPKVALDDFWIKCGGNVDKSRELIRIFYTRVLYSNLYFTSFKEGWRTERGMIYIIYGPPDKVYKTSDGESWGYRKPLLKSSWGGRYHLKEDYLYFNFRYRKNKFSDNDYYISRSETLVTQWDKAVATWKKGIVFRLDNPEDF